MSEEPLMNGRARRAVPLVAAALTVAVVAGLLWLRPQLGGPGRLGLPAPSPTAPTLGSAYKADYYFVTRALGWALVERSGGVTNQSQFWLFKTSDGAGHWTEQTSGTVDAIGYEQLAFLDARNVPRTVPIPGSGLALTSDGGVHWRYVNVPHPA